MPGSRLWRSREFLAALFLLLLGAGQIGDADPGPAAAAGAPPAVKSEGAPLSAEALAAALLAARSDADRQALLVANPEWKRSKLVGVLLSPGDKECYIRAREIFQRARERFEEIGDTAGAADAQFQLATVYRTEGHHSEAIEAYRDCLKRYTALDNMHCMAQAWYVMGKLHAGQARYDEARDCYRNSLELAQEAGNRELMASTQIHLGSVHKALGDLGAALNAFRQARDLYEAAGNREGVAKAGRGIGEVHRRMGENHAARAHYEAARDCYARSLAACQEAGDKAGAAGALEGLVWLHRQEGSYRPAVDLYRQLVALREETNDRTRAAGTLVSLGDLHFGHLNAAEALRCYLRGLTLYEAVGSRVKAALTLKRIGRVYANQQNAAPALAYFHRSLALYEELGDRLGTASLLREMARAYQNRRRPGTTLDLLQRSRALFAAAGDRKEVAATLRSIAEVYRATGDRRPALEHARQALALCQSLGDPGEIAGALSKLGWIHRSFRDYDEALEAYQRSLALYPSHGSRVSAADTWKNIGYIHLYQGRLDAAQAAFREGLSHAEAAGHPDLIVRCVCGIGEVYRAERRTSAAIAAYRRAIDVIETMRSQAVGDAQEQPGFFERHAGTYYCLAALLIAQRRASEALAVVERARARVLLDVLRGGGERAPRAMTAAERAQERRLTGALAALNAQVYQERQRLAPDASRLALLAARQEQSRRDLRVFQTSRVAAHPEPQALCGEAPPMTVEEALALIPGTRGALLVFAVADPGAGLFVLTRERRTPSLAVFNIQVKGAALAQKVARFRQRLAQRDARCVSDARSLYDLLLKPAQRHLQGRTSLVIVPDGPLWDLPFQALQPAPGRYLIEQSAISYVPSLTVLREMRRSRTGGRAKVAGRSTTPDDPLALLAVGNPALRRATAERVRRVHRGTRLDPLPETEAEVQVLRRLYGAKRSRVFVGAAAREKSVKAEAGRSRVLHFATHGVLDDGNPMYSHVVLSQAAGGERDPGARGMRDKPGDAAEDGILEAWEMMELDLVADLVVLSACETARGRVSAGEGVMGMTWALFIAGCPTTVASHWKVESRSTSRLMLEFHRQLLESGRGRPAGGKAEALRRAQLKLLRSGEFRDPFYWAGFALFGDGA